MSENQGTVTFTPVDFGDPLEIPPEAPEGDWAAFCKVTERSVEDKNDPNVTYPALSLQWTLEQALTDGNESHVGAKVSDWITFYPKGHEYERMQKQTIANIQAGLKLEVSPDTSSLRTGSFASLAPWVEALESRKHVIRTYINKKGETKPAYVPRKGKEGAKVATRDETVPRRRRVA